MMLSYLELDEFSIGQIVDKLLYGEEFKAFLIFTASIICVLTAVNTLQQRPPSNSEYTIATLLVSCIILTHTFDVRLTTGS